MQIHPRLQSERLQLRAFLADDATLFSQIASTHEVADGLISLPHPVSPAMARSLIAAQAASFQSSRAVYFAVERREEPGLVGCVELRDIEREHQQAELGFWLDPEVWGHGYAAEAARAVVQYGLDELRLNRVYAHHMVRNAAAGAVLLAIGMKQEGILRERVRKWERFEDVALYALLRSDGVPAAAS